MKLVSLELSPSEAKQEVGAAPQADLPKYPYGTCLNLDEDELAKLGMKEMPSVGTVIPITAMAKVTGTSEREYEGSGSQKTLELQITDMAFGDEDDNAGTAMEGAAKKVYG